MNNYQKNERYSELMEKLKKSIEEEFYYESIFIIYAILEDRTESILRHANIETVDENNRPLSLNTKLNKISKDDIFEQEYIKKHLPKDLISQIHVWKNKRNVLMHDLVNTEYDNEKIKILALNGYELIKKINNKSILVNKYNDKNLINN